MPELGPQFEVACNRCDESTVVASQVLAEDLREDHVDTVGCSPERVVVQEVSDDA